MVEFFCLENYGRHRDWTTVDICAESRHTSKQANRQGVCVSSTQRANTQTLKRKPFSFSLSGISRPNPTSVRIPVRNPNRIDEFSLGSESELAFSRV